MNTEILNWLVSPWEGDSGGVKRTKRDEPIGVVIHICMETTQGIGEQEGETVSAGGGGWHQWKEEVVRKGAG
jgi:hypothetical protein